MSGISVFKKFVSAFIFVLLFNNAWVYSQDSFSSIYVEDTTFSYAQARELRFGFRNLNFFRNNEYKGGFVKGYTLPGLWLVPSVSYQPISSVKIEAGAYMLKYWGEASYPNLHYGNLPGHIGEGEQKGFHALPFFRVRYAPLNGVSLIIGNIYGQNNHRLIAPLYNSEMAMTSDPEAGVQLLWNNRFLDFDMWINWEDFIFQGDNHQEEFMYGISARIKANNPVNGFSQSGSFTPASSNNVHVYFPVQIIYKHKGGEINTSATDRKVRTWLNAAAGFGLDFKMPYKYFNRLNLEADAAYYAQQKGTTFPFDNGYGFLGKVSADFKDLRLTAGYWQCHNFVSLYGDPLFGAVSVSEDGTTFRNPKMGYMRLEYLHRIAKGFTLGVHAEVYNSFPADVDRTVMDESGTVSISSSRNANSISFLAGICLRTDFSFLIKKF